MNKSYIRVLGSANWHATAHNDLSCYTIDDKILIDACPSVITQLQEHGIDPMDISFVFFTHMHIDHCLGLAPLLHYWRVRKHEDKTLKKPTIIGPKATVRDTVVRAMRFVFDDRPKYMQSEMPQIIELEGDMALDLPGYQIRVMNSDHTVPGLCYRITNTESGRVIGLTGDTAYLPAFSDFFSDVDLLVHEVSYGGAPAAVLNVSRHSGAPEAVRVSQEAHVKNLLLTHAYEPRRAAAMEVARSQLNIPVEWAMPGKVYYMDGLL